MEFDVKAMSRQVPVLEDLAAARETVWINPALLPTGEALSSLPLTMADVDDAEARLARFAPFIETAFPETAPQGGLIESPLRPIPAMQERLNQRWSAGLPGRLLLKMDSHLAVAGSVKARGGIYEILKHSEDLALQAGLIAEDGDYRRFASPEFHDFFSRYAIHVGSTGNLGLSIGIMSAALGYRVTVHMSTDARQWKKDLLRSKGVNVIEYASDYSAAVEEGRRLAAEDPMSYFVDDENSKTLFLGYAVAAKRLRRQLEEMAIPVDGDHPLFLYIPCGVGGAPGGVCFGAKELWGDDVYVFFVEPTQAPCMALGMATGLHSAISVQDIGLTGLTAADGLAVGRPSGFVGKAVEHLVSGEFTVEDDQLYRYMDALLDSEGIFIEPSACAAFQGPCQLLRHPASSAFLDARGLRDKLENAAHIAWATGGSLAPDTVREEYRAKARSLS